MFNRYLKVFYCEKTKNPKNPGFFMLGFLGFIGLGFLGVFFVANPGNNAK